MSLNIPHSRNRTIAQQNLDCLLGIGINKKPSLDDVITPVAKEAIADYNKSQLGLMHEVKKGCASFIGFAAPVTGIVATGVGGAYLYLNNMDKIHGDSYAAGQNPMVDMAKTVAVTVGPVILADIGIQKMTGYSVVKPVARWATSMLSSIALFASYKSSQAVESGYKKMEENAKQVSLTSRQRLFDQLFKAYNSVADELSIASTDAEGDAKAQYDLSKRMTLLKSNLPTVEKLLSKAPLTNSEITDILDKLKSTMKSIEKVSLSLKTGNTQEDIEYNLSLMNILTDKEFVSIAIPRYAVQEVILAKSNAFNIVKKVTQTASILANGTMAGVGTAVAVGAAAAMTVIGAKAYNFVDVNQCSKFQGYCVEDLGVLGTTAISTLFVAGQTMFDQHAVYTAKVKAADAAIIEHTSSAKRMLKRVYRGMAQALEDQNGDDAVALAQAVQSKLNGIDAQIRSLGVLKNPANITAQLRAAVNAKLNQE